MRIILLIISLISAMPAMAIEVAGVAVKDEIRVGKHALVLNGAGIRSKFIVKVYVGSLYLQSKSNKAEAIINADTVNRIGMQFLYSKVDREDVTEAWSDGFAANLSAKQLSSLAESIRQFNALFPDMRKGDQVNLDYIPGKGPSVVINGSVKGVVKGSDFNQALQRIWLGKSPVTDDLKAAMLGL